MTTGHVFMAQSLDGFVARPNHGIDWLTKLPSVGSDYGYKAFAASVDGIVMGRGSFETVLEFGDWPYDKPAVVMSKSLKPDDIPPELKDVVRLSTLEPAALMQQLDEEGWSRAYVDGGRLVQSFIRAGLVEDIVLSIVPILIGEGLRLFGSLPQDIDLELRDSTSFDNGLVQLEYRLIPTYPEEARDRTS
ncbi:MAG: dihydrofolate reductase family protein [Myxococcota bacterium]